MAIDPSIPLQVRGYSPLLALGQGIQQGINLRQAYEDREFNRQQLEQENERAQREAQLKELQMAAPLIPAIQQHSADPGQRMQFATRLINDLGFQNLPRDLYNDPSDFTDENLQAVSTALSQANQEDRRPFQFSSTFTVKDRDNNEFIAVQRRDPSGREPVQTMYSPIDPNGPRQPIGGVQITGEYGLTAQGVPQFRRSIKEAEREGELKTQLNYVGRIESAQELARQQAQALGESVTQLQLMEAALPELRQAIGRLKELAPVATSTLGGQVFNTVVKELGFGATEGATARAAYEAVINQQVLPLLKPTFGGNTSDAELNNLRITLGDPNLAPEAKIAVLDEFIASEEREVRSQQRQVNIRQRALQGGAMQQPTPAQLQQPATNQLPPPPQGMSHGEWQNMWLNDFSEQDRQDYLNAGQ